MWNICSICQSQLLLKCIIFTVYASLVYCDHLPLCLLQHIKMDISQQGSCRIAHFLRCLQATLMSICITSILCSFPLYSAHTVTVLFFTNIYFNHLPHVVMLVLACYTQYESGQLCVLFCLKGYFIAKNIRWQVLFTASYTAAKDLGTDFYFYITKKTIMYFQEKQTSLLWCSCISASQ